MPQRIIPPSLVPLGMQVMSLANTTASPVNSTCRLAQVFLISVETVDARIRFDAAAANSTGLLVPQGLGPYMIDGFNYVNSTTTLSVARSGTSGTSKVTLQAFRYTGNAS